MNTPARPALIALALVSALLTAGCSSAASSGPGPAPEAPPAGTPFLATSFVTPVGTWAIAVMGGSVAAHNNFWQMFARPAGSTSWKLVTPPGVADNGGLVAAGAGGQSLITGIRPSQYLTYTPLALTRDGGRAWSPAGPLDAALANTPGALAVAPRTGRLLALLATGTVKAAAPGYTQWTTLTSRRSLATTPAGRRCGLASLTAAAFTASGTPLLAGRCSRPGTAGIFAAKNGTWQAAGPALRATLGHRATAVLRLTRTSRGIVALLETGTGPDASLLAAWSAGGGHWTMSPPGPADQRKAGFGVHRPRRSGSARTDRQPRRDHHRCRGDMAIVARIARRHRHPGPRALRRVRRARGPPHQADHLATRARHRRLACHASHERSRPVRLIGLTWLPSRRDR